MLIEGYEWEIKFMVIKILKMVIVLSAMVLTSCNEGGVLSNIKKEKCTKLYSKSLVAKATQKENWSHSSFTEYKPLFPPYLFNYGESICIDTAGKDAHAYLFAKGDERPSHIFEKDGATFRITHMGLRMYFSTTPLELEKIPVPSDPNAEYYLIPKIHTINTRLRGVDFKKSSTSAITMRKTGTSISYSEREINCKEPSFRYLRDGDNLPEFLRSKAYKSTTLSRLENKSISFYVAQHVCRNARY